MELNLEKGKTYTGDEIARALDIDMADQRYYAFVKDEQAVIVRDEGNDNFEVVAIVGKEKTQVEP